MEDPFEHVRKLIEQGDDSEARALLRAEIRKNPTAEAYYLASKVAYNDEQKVMFLENALELDPGHISAKAALDARKPAAPPPPVSSSPSSFTQMRDLLMSSQRLAEPRVTPAADAAAQPVRLADPSARFVAYFIDTIILLIIGSVVSVVLDMLLSLVGLSGTSTADTVVLLVGIALQGYYYVYFLVSKQGQTPGKQMCNIRIVRKDGQPLSASDAILRNIIGYFLCGLTFLVGFLWVFVDKDRQGLHDKIANTLVVQAEQPSRDRLF